MGYAENNREETEDGSKHSSVKLRKYNDSTGCEDSVEQVMNDLCRSSNSKGCERVIRNNSSPPGKPISSKLPAHIIGDVLEVYEFVHRFYEVLDFQVVPSFKELEEELSCPGFDLNETEEVKDKAEAQRSVKSDGTLMTKIHIQLLKLIMCEIASVRVIGDNEDSKSKPGMHEIESVHVIGDIGETKSKPEVKKGTERVIAANGCQPHVLVNELTWPEMARRYVLALLSIKRSLVSVKMNDSDKSKVFRCLQSDGGLLCGSTGVAGIEEDVNVLVEAIKRVYGSLDTENDIQYVNSSRYGTTQASDKAMLMDTDNLGWSQELEPVRKLATNVGSRIRNCINSALGKGPPLWAKNILEHSISKEIYKGNASGPTKKLVNSVLDNLCITDLAQQPNQERSNRKPLLQSKVVMKRCHFALRRFLRSSFFYSFHANAKNKDLCNLLSVQLLELVEAKKGILDSPVKLSRPLDLLTVDLRLSAGAYGTSYEDFLDDVRQVLANLRAVHIDEPELLQVANKLSDKFEQHYEIEVNSLLKRHDDYGESDYIGLKKNMDDILASSRELPKSPLKHQVCKEGEVCKVCGIDVNDEVVLLCDQCEKGYHTYCLEPPLQAVPPGNWFCPRCVETSVDLSVEPSMENPEATHDALLPANLEDLSVNDVVKAINPLAAAMTQKEYGQWSLDERVFLLKFLCDELLNSSVIRQHLQESIGKKQTRADTKEMQQSEDMPSTQNNMLQSEDMPDTQNNVESELLLNREICLSKLSLRREYLGADSSGRLYWILSEPNRVPFLIVDPSSSSIPWVSYQSEEEIDELLGWLNGQDQGERLLKESIEHFKKTNVNYPNKNEKQGEVLVYGKRNNCLGIKATSLLTTKFASPNDVSATESCNKEVWRCDCLELIFPPRHHCLCCHKTFLSSMGLKLHNGGQCKTGIALEKVKEPSSSIAHDEHKENELRPVSGKSAPILRQLKMDLLDIEAALPEGALNRRKSQPEERQSWRAFVKTSVTILETIQAVILLEDMIKIDYLKNWWCYWASPSAAVKRPTLSSLALRIYALDSAIEYENNPEPDTLTLPQESVPQESKKRRKGKLHI